jgi:hypothetical protein
MNRSQETRLAKPEQVRSARARRYCFHFDEVAEAEAQGLPYALVPRVLSRQEWIEQYACHSGVGALPSTILRTHHASRSAACNGKDFLSSRNAGTLPIRCLVSGRALALSVTEVPEFG